MRCFVAIPLDSEVRENLDGLRKEIAGIKGIKGVPVENLHLTLDFLGEIDENECQRFCRNLTAVAGTVKPFSMEICRLGAFGKNGSVQTLWVSAEPRKNLKLLATAVKTAVDSNDIKKFSPHITLGRIKKESAVTRDFCEKLLANTAEFFGKQQVECFQLLKSDLSGKNPQYSVIKTFWLNNGGANG